MVHKVLRFISIIIFITAIAIMVLIDGPREDHGPKVIMHMRMVPIDDCPGEYILEYDNGNRELLKEDGSRIPLQSVEVK